ncbi:hypothetical protein ACLQ3C_05275 [Gordonia sp. DT30]|uniref:hypothetical protein n=1 Tax=unclassified Gordonia (in: high G+C Gram-positive bacteria) TaxID=2657482 RepID=UPI003CEA2B98
MKHLTVKNSPVAGSPRAKTRRRMAAATLAVALAGSIATGTASTASAAPPAPAAVHDVSQLDDITYSAAFGLGVQIYERTGMYPQPGGAVAMMLRRVTSPRDGDPRLPKYALVGSPLPREFASYNGADEPDVLYQLGYTIDPRTGKQVSPPPPRLRLGLAVGRVGPFAGAAAVWPSLLPG